MKISMFSAALVLEMDPENAINGYEFVGNVELKFGDETVMEWPITANKARDMAYDDTALDKFVAEKFRDVFEKTDRLSVE